MPTTPEHTANPTPQGGTTEDTAGRAGFAMILAALLPVAGAASLFLGQVDLHVLLREWLRPEASGSGLSMIVMATLAGGPLLAACLGE